MPTRRTSPALTPLATALAVVLGLTASCAAADAPVASDPVFTALKVDGSVVSGRIRQFGPNSAVTLVTAEGPERTIPPGMLVKLTREGRAAPASPEASVVLFPGGDRLYRTAIVAANETHLEVDAGPLERLSVPLESLLGLIFTPPPNPEALGLPTGADALETLAGRVRNEPRSTEVVWLNNGDRLTGGFLGLTDKAVELQPPNDKEKIRVDRVGVVALGFEPSLVVYPAPEGPFLELTLHDGSRLGVSEPRVVQGHVVARTRFGAPVRVPIAELSRVHARTPSVVYLTEREPAETRYVPYIGPLRPFRRDATVEGHPFRLSGQEYDRGIGTQSRTLLAYRLDGGDQRFQAQVGVDDRAGPLGSVQFRVLVDGRESFDSGLMAARDAPKAVDVSVLGAKTLILITGFGDRGGVRDFADWVEARVIRGRPFDSK